MNKLGRAISAVVLTWMTTPLIIAAILLVLVVLAVMTASILGVDIMPIHD